MRFLAVATSVVLAATLLAVPTVSSASASTDTVGAGGTAAATSAATSAAPVIGPNKAPRPVVDGNRLIDTVTNKTFVPHGVNWPSFEYACAQNFGYSATGATLLAAQNMRSWDINTVRIPLNQSCWLGSAGSDYEGADYRTAVRNWVNTLHSVGIVAILDLHWSAPVSPDFASNSAGQRSMPDADSVVFWRDVATTFSADPSVIFDAFNEPYSYNNAQQGQQYYVSWSCWRDGGCDVPVDINGTTASGATYKAVGMSALVAAIRGASAKQPILLSGLSYGNDLSQWQQYAPADTTGTRGPQLIAGVHVYNFNACSTVDCWTSNYTPVSASVPVFAAELGENDGSAAFLNSFMSWADTNGIGYSPWAWWDLTNEESPSAENLSFALIADSDFTPLAPAGTTYRQHLLDLPGAHPDPVPTTVLTSTFESSSKSWAVLSKPLTMKRVKKSSVSHGSSRYLSATTTKKKARTFGPTIVAASLPGDQIVTTVYLRSGTKKSVTTTVTVLTRGGTTEKKAIKVKIGTKWKAVKLTLPVSKTGHTGIRLQISIASTKSTLLVDDTTIVRNRY